MSSKGGKTMSSGVSGVSGAGGVGGAAAGSPGTGLAGKSPQRVGAAPGVMSPGQGKGSTVVAGDGNMVGNTQNQTLIHNETNNINVMSTSDFCSLHSMGSGEGVGAISEAGQVGTEMSMEDMMKMLMMMIIMKLMEQMMESLGGGSSGGSGAGAAMMGGG